VLPGSRTTKGKGRSEVAIPIPKARAVTSEAESDNEWGDADARDAQGPPAQLIALNNEKYG
jgi:hypothetical protein